MKIKIGIDGLDKILGGGIEENKAFLITGGSGTGKTIFCLQFVITGLKKGESAVYVTVNERAEDILEDARSFGWELKKYIDSGKLYIIDMPTYTTIEISKGEALDTRRMIADTLGRIRKLGARRVVVESIDYIAAHSSENVANAQEFLREAVLTPENPTGVTLLITSVPPSNQMEQSMHSMEERVVDGIFSMDFDEKSGRRMLFIKKMRKSKIGLSKYEYNIDTKRGIRLVGG